MGARYATAYGEIGESNQRLLMGKMGSFLLVLNTLNSLPPPNFPAIPISDLGRAPQCRLSIKSNIADPIIVNCQLSIINWLMVAAYRNCHKENCEL